MNLFLSEAQLVSVKGTKCFPEGNKLFQRLEQLKQFLNKL